MDSGLVVMSRREIVEHADPRPLEPGKVLGTQHEVQTRKVFLQLARGWNVQACSRTSQLIPFDPQGGSHSPPEP